MNSSNLYLLLKIAGLGQIILGVVSLAIPKLMGWKKELGVLRPLIKQMFWTYAGYIFFINVFWGIISFVAPDELLNRSLLASSLTFFIAIYWGARIVIQFLYFDRKDAPKGPVYLIGEVGLIMLFAFLSFVYGFAFFFNSIS